MSDLREAVRRRLGLQCADARRTEEIVAELTDHLGDLVEEWLRRGATAEEATRHALNSIPDWDELRLKIQRAEQEEDIMNDRVKAVWLPGAASTALFMALFQFFQPWVSKSHVTWALHGTAATLGPYDLHFLVVNWQWLLCLPIVGAFAAYWSRRMGGTALQRALAASSPGLGLCCFLAVLLSVLFVHDFPDSLNIPFLAVASLGMFLWGVLPALAVLLGVFPFLRGSHEFPRHATSG